MEPGRDRSTYGLRSLARFFTSQHVADLKWLFFAVFLLFPFLLYTSAHLFNLSMSDGTLLSAVLAGIFTIMSWCYQAGNLRLGTVDLYSSEIVTLCRVSAVIDLVRRYVELDHKSGARLSGTPSSESYTTIFDSNSGQLQSLSREVVAHVTAFYTYMRAVRDGIRSVLAIQDGLAAGVTSPAWTQAHINMIYMLFLAFESGRNAITELIEDPPDRADAQVTILLSEIPAYAFLRGKFKDRRDYLLRKRIKLRHETYARIIPEICASALGRPQSKKSAYEVAARWESYLNEFRLGTTFGPAALEAIEIARSGAAAPPAAAIAPPRPDPALNA